MNFVETMRRAAVRGAQTAYDSVAAAKEGVVSTSRSRVVKALTQAATFPYIRTVVPARSWLAVPQWGTSLCDRLVTEYKQPFVSAFQDVVKKDSESQKKLFTAIEDKMVKGLSVQKGGKTVTADALFEEPYLSLLKIKSFGISDKELDEFKEGNDRKFARIKDVKAPTREKILKAVIVLSVEVGIFGQEIIRFLRDDDSYKTLMAHLGQKPANQNHPDHTFAFCSALLGNDQYRGQLMTEVRIQMAMGLQTMLEANAERQEKEQEAKAGYMAKETVRELGHRIAGVLGENPQLKAAKEKYDAELKKNPSARNPQDLFASLAGMGVQAFSLAMTMLLTAKTHLTAESEKDAHLNSWEKRTQSQAAIHMPLIGDLCPPALANSQSDVANLGPVTEKYVSACHEAGDQDYLDIARTWHAVTNLFHNEMVTTEDANGDECEKSTRVYDLDVPLVLKGLVQYINGKSHALTPEQHRMLEELIHRNLIRYENGMHLVNDDVETTEQTLAALVCSVRAQSHIVFLYRALMEAQLITAREQADEDAGELRKIELECEKVTASAKLDRARSLLRMSVSEGCQVKLDAEDALITQQPEWVEVSSLAEKAKKAVNEAEKNAQDVVDGKGNPRKRKRSESDADVVPQNESPSSVQESDDDEDSDGSVVELSPSPEKKRRRPANNKPRARKTAPKNKPVLTAAERRKQAAAERKKQKDTEGKTDPASGGRRKPQPRKAPTKSVPKPRKVPTKNVPKPLTQAQLKKQRAAELKKQKDEELARKVKEQKENAEKLAKLYGRKNKKPVSKKPATRAKNPIPTRTLRSRPQN